MPPELAQWIVPLIVIFGTLSPAVIIVIMLYLHRVTRQDMSRLEGRMDRLESQIGNLRDRLGRIEGRLDELREFFFRSGGTAA